MTKILEDDFENNFTKYWIRATFLDLASLYYMIHYRRVDFQK